jgi:hypothetical protein
MSDPRQPIGRHRFVAQELVEQHPPRWRDRNKTIVYEIACPPGSTHPGQLEYSRWAAMPLPGSVDPGSAAARAVSRPGFFDYVPEADRPEAVEWHVNFADPRLFVAYASGLFAQDEMQVSEHPSLGSLKEALDAGGIGAVTEESGGPTPVLVTGVARRCRVATDPDASEGRPYGLYGNAFARGSEEAIRRATTRIDPPTTTHLIAMAAPSYGRGAYRADEIERILVTAYTAFRAAVLESDRSLGPGRPVVVHTGFWGCGAFGGNRILMTALQTAAAGLAGVDRTVFHTGDPSGDGVLGEAKRLLGSGGAGGPALPVGELIRRVHVAGLEWGTSDGN